MRTTTWGNLGLGLYMLAAVIMVFMQTMLEPSSTVWLWTAAAALLTLFGEMFALVVHFTRLLMDVVGDVSITDVHDPAHR